MECLESDGKNLECDYFSDRTPKQSLQTYRSPSVCITRKQSISAQTFVLTIGAACVSFLCINTGV